MTVDPDAQLAAMGDVEAFERIYRRYHARIYSLCLRMIKNASQAEDLVQEVFIQLFRKLHTFRGESSFSTWLHRLTVNRLRSRAFERSVHARSLQRREEERQCDSSRCQLTYGLIK